MIFSTSTHRISTKFYIPVPSLADTSIPLLRDKFGILIIVNCHGFEDIEKEGEHSEKKRTVDRAYNA